MQIQILKLNNDASIPKPGTPNSAGYDLKSLEDYDLKPGERKLFKTGLAFSIPIGIFGRIAPRSGLAYKQGIDVLGGICDCDYRGDIGVILINLGQQVVNIKKNDSIAQIIFEYYNTVTFECVQQLSESVRGDGGFGHTDNKKHSSQNIMDLLMKANPTTPTPSRYETLIKERDSKFKI